jgi:hypothetical protein
MARHGGRTLKRRGADRKPRTRLLVLCEGQVTEPKYLKAFKHDHRSQLVEVEVVPECGVPKTLVEAAVARKKDADREARRRGDPYLKYDEVWCVFDVDQHPNLPEAKQQAQANGLHVAISNPCFELWVLLHFQDQRAHQERGQIQAACREHLPEFVKEVPYEKIRPGYRDAVRRAQALEDWQDQQQRPGGNPSTGVHELTGRISNQGKEAFLLDRKRG